MEHPLTTPSHHQLRRSQRGPGVLATMLIAALAVMLAALPGCVSSSGTPTYPPDWPARLSGGQSASMRSFAGEFEALSEAPPLLHYPLGQRPYDWSAVVPLPVASPPLGRRVLTSHLAGVTSNSDPQRWIELCEFAQLVDHDADDPALPADPGWVSISPTSAGWIEVRAGVRSGRTVEFSIQPGRKPSAWAGLWRKFQPLAYFETDDSLVVRGEFALPAVEVDPAHSRTQTRPAVALGEFRFWPAADGSLIMLETRFGATGGDSLFQTWWRWRPRVHDALTPRPGSPPASGRTSGGESRP